MIPAMHPKLAQGSTFANRCRSGPRSPFHRSGWSCGWVESDVGFTTASGKIRENGEEMVRR